MSLVSTQQHSFVDSKTSLLHTDTSNNTSSTIAKPEPSPSPPPPSLEEVAQQQQPPPQQQQQQQSNNPTTSTEDDLSTLLGAFTNSGKSSMERGANEYSQSGLHSPFAGALNDSQSEDSPADHASAALRQNNSSFATTSATPTSEYGVYPASARSSSFPEHIQRQLQSSANQGASMAANPQNPSIAASSPTYPTGGQYSPYPQQQDMHHGYAPHGGMYAQPRPDWAGYASHAQHVSTTGYPVSGAQTPTSAAPSVPNRTGQVYSFVPIPGAQQHKRPRRRYEEIERMYKCGWNGCEKAYGTLNHLNAHVTMQSHGTKRTPEEFKEIRKEWKARKKEEENARKADDERARATVAPGDAQQADAVVAQGYPSSRAQVQLPPIGYQPGTQVPAQYQAPSGGVQQLQEYSTQSQQQMYSGYPTSPYGAPNQMYSQHNGTHAPQPKYEH